MRQANHFVVDRLSAILRDDQRYRIASPGGHFERKILNLRQPVQLQVVVYKLLCLSAIGRSRQTMPDTVDRNPQSLVRHRLGDYVFIDLLKDLRTCWGSFRNIGFGSRLTTQQPQEKGEKGKSDAHFCEFFAQIKRIIAI